MLLDFLLPHSRQLLQDCLNGGDCVRCARRVEGRRDNFEGLQHGVERVQVEISFRAVATDVCRESRLIRDSLPTLGAVLLPAGQGAEALWPRMSKLCVVQGTTGGGCGAYTHVFV